jgi:murein DD-endopeptidase MepM/ murein hydrolase activator NlpD
MSGGYSSGFGNRVHPVYGTVRFHSGLDLNGSQGAPIGAAGAGTVIFAGWYDGYGNTILIDHGGGISTLYGHMSGFAVSTGQAVTAGATIGYVGSTGVSTGPHCHFEVRVNGSVVDPLGYLP